MDRIAAPDCQGKDWIQSIRVPKYGRPFVLGKAKMQVSLGLR